MIDPDILKARVIGGLIGFFIGGYFLIFSPMHQNYKECGKVTLCPTPQTHNGNNYQ